MFSETVLFFRLMCFQQCFIATQNIESKCFIQHTDVCTGPEIKWLLSPRCFANIWGKNPALLRLYTDVFYIGDSRVSWLKTLFTMLPKDLRAEPTTDFRPIANLRLLYKTFAYLLLGRLEHVLDANQSEEQHGFRARRRLEEHPLSANILWDKSEAIGFPVWSMSFHQVHGQYFSPNFSTDTSIQPLMNCAIP